MVCLPNGKEQVKRNHQRFPHDFVFGLTAAEKSELVAKCDYLSKLKYLKTAPYAFTEHGALMAPSALNTVRAFGRLREMFASHKRLARKLDEMEKKNAHQFRVAAAGTICAPPENHGVRARRRVAKVVTICDHLR